MHIPDGVLSPSTCAAAAAVMVPIWWTAARKLKTTLGAKQLPVLALGSAFCFTIMMFNVPAPGGTTAHPVAGTLLAILLGPWAAIIGVSTAIAIQALFFGDGGVLAYGANSFTMAFVLPMVGYAVYRLVAGKSSNASNRRALAAGVGSFVGINTAASIVGVLLGIQPLLFRDASGHPLYFPFGLNITVPSMLAAHLLLAGPAEAIVTAMVVRYMQRTGYTLYGCATEATADQNRSRRWESLWVGILAMIALSPLGLIAQGDAFGEWNAEDIRKVIFKVTGQSFVPKGMAHLQAMGYHPLSILQDYAQSGSSANVPGYIGAGILGVSSILVVVTILGRRLTKSEQAHYVHGEPNPSLTPSQSSGGLPIWLSASNSDEASHLSAGKNNPFLQRTLAELTSGTATALRADRWANQSGYLQTLNPAAKLAGFLVLLITAAVSHSLAVLAVLLIFANVAAYASGIPVGVLNRRVLLSAPLFVGGIAIPLMFSFASPGHPLVVLWHSPYVAVTTEGVSAFTLLILRVAATVAMAVLLTMSTPWHKLLAAMRSLKVPSIFVALMAMTYRYITVLLQTADDMFTARKSRTVGRVRDAEARRFVGNGIGVLFSKTLALTDEVVAAMTARGYTGEVKVVAQSVWQRKDKLWIACIFITAIALTLGEHYHG